MNDVVRSASSGNAKIEIYTRRYCGYCVRAKMLLDEKGVDYIEIPIDGDAEARQQMIQRAEGGFTVPQILINGNPIGGYAELYMLEHNGELDELLSQV
jgi:glutaredoxin 3